MDIYQIFVNRVHKTPNDIMIYTDDSEITYLKAYKMVNYYAKRIIEKTSGKRTRILLNLNHSYKIIISILAIIKTGNSYVPIEANANDKRFTDIAGYCNTDIIISDTNRFVDMRQIVFDTERYAESYDDDHYKYSSEDEIYVLFTSGSTGEPKGCSILYSNLCYIIENMITISKCDEKSIYSFSTPYVFDVSTTEIYSFVYGASIYVCNTADYNSFRKFPEIIKENKITHLALSPSSFKNMLNAYTSEQLTMMSDTLKCVMVAGEVFKREIFNEWDKKKWKYRLLNLYGPTEATVYATGYELKAGEKYETSIPIGKCLDGCKFFIDNKDENGIGELVLGGRGIANGYINNKNEQKKRFFMLNGERYYRTGDLVSLENDLLIYHGRNDDQVQINGIRVELGEIESKIRELDEVKDAVVFYHKGILVAALILNSKNNLDTLTLKRLLKNKMPRYMIPNVFLYVDRFELNASNKIDRKKILQIYMEKKKDMTDKNNVSDIENEVLKLMKECIKEKNENIALNDDFYECGADSLDTFLLAVNLEHHFHIKLNADIIYTYRTARKIAEYLNNRLGKVDYLNKKSNKVFKQIVELTAQIKKYIYTNTCKVKQKYEVLYIQNYYYTGKLDSSITFRYDIGKQYSTQHVKKALIDLLRSNSILYSKMEEENGRIYFKEYEVEENMQIPEVILDTENYSILNFIENNYANEMFYSRYKNGFLAVFIIVNMGGMKSIIGILDHTIADAASISLIKIKIGNLLNNKKNNPALSYKNYCELVRSNNNNIDEALKSWYILKLKESKIDQKDQLFKKLINKEQYLIIDSNNEGDNIAITKQICYLLGQKMSNIIENKCISLRSIINLREYKEHSFKETIGDLHVSISFFYNRNDTFQEFDKRANKAIDYFSNKYFRHSVYIKDNFTVDKEKQMQLKSIVDGADLVSVNYIGMVDDDELEDYKSSIEGIHKKLFKIDKRIYATAFTNNHKLHIFINQKI